MATIEDLKIVFESIEANVVQQTSMLSAVSSAASLQSDLVEEQNTILNNILSVLNVQQRQNELARADRSSEGTPARPNVKKPETAEPKTEQQRSGAGPLSGILGGIGLGALGRGAIAAAGGLAAMGLGISAFFGGLMAGDAALGWLEDMGASFSFENLKAAALGFSDIILEMDPKAFMVLGGIMGISAIGGTRAAMGLGTMGFAITAFLGGLLAGDALFSKVVGENVDFSSMKAVMSGFSDMILSLDPKAMAVMGGLLGIGAISGALSKNPLGVGLGMGALGFGISGFLGGLLAGDLLFQGVSALGGNIDFSSLSTALGGFSNAIDQLTPEAAAALASILGAAGVSAIFGRGTGVQAATRIASTMAGIGAGISGLMIGLTAGDAAMSWIQSASGSTGDGLTTAFRTFSRSVGELSPEAAGALAGILGVGGIAAVFGRGTGIAAATRIATITAGIGAGIAGLMIGLTAGDVGIQWMNDISGADGSAMVGAFQMFNDSVSALNNENAIMALTGIIAAGSGIGAIIGAVGTPAAAVMAAAGIFAIMTGIGAGISGLMIGLTAGDVAMSWMSKLKGSEGGLVEAFRMFNDSITAITPEGIERLTQLSQLNLGSGLLDLANAVTSFFAIDIKEGLGDRVRNFFTSLFGGEVEEESIITKLLREFEPLSGEQGAALTRGVDRFATALDPLATALGKLSDINPDNIDFTSIAENLAESIPLFHHLANGGVYDPWGLGNRIDFGKGILDPELRLDEVAAKIVQVRQAISGVMDDRTLNDLNLVGSGAGVTPAANVTVAPVNVSPTTVNNVSGGSSSTNVNVGGGGGRRDLDDLARPGGVN